MKIKPKLALAFILASLVPLVILSVFSYNNAKESVTNGVLNQLQSVAVIQKHRIESIISQNLERLALVSSRTQLRISLDSYLKQNSTADQERMNTILLDARSSIKDFEEIYVLNLDGEVVASTSETIIGSSLANEEAFIQGRAGEDSGALLFLNGDEELKNYLSGPLYLESELIGVVIIRSSADNILSVLGDYTGLGRTGETLLAERSQEGNVLFISPLHFAPEAELHRTMSIYNLDSPTVQALLGNEGLFTNAVDYRGETVLAAAQYIPEVDWGLVAKIDEAEALAPVTRLYNLTALTIGLAAALVVTVSLYLARSISKPIQSLASVADKIREGDVSQRAEVKSNDEIGMMAQHFNEMTENLVRTNNTLRSANRALKTLSECNQILVRSTDEPTLLKGICRIIVTYGEYCGARVGLIDPRGGLAVRPAAEAWHDNGDCSHHDVAWAENEDDHAMFKEAVNSGKPLVLRNIHSDTSHAPLHAEANERGYTSLITLPLSINSQPSGVLIIYSAGADPFEEGEVKLLTELADDLAYGIKAQRMRVEREQAEEALKESEERYRSLVNNVRLGILRSTPDTPGKILEMNPAFEEITGYSRDELMAMGVEDLYIRREDRQALMKEVASTKGVVTKEIKCRRKDGSEIMVLDTVAALRDDAGKILYVDAIVEDITERKRLEEDLREEQQELKLIIDSSPILVFYKDKEGRFVRVNRALAEAYEVSEEEFVGKTVFDLCSARIAQEMTNDDQEVLKLRRPKFNIIEQYESASGIRWVQTDKVPILDKDDIPVGLIGFSQDITERKQAEEALRESEERYRSFVQNFSGIAYRGDKNFKASFLHGRVKEITGYTEDDFMKGKVKWQDIIHKDDLPRVLEDVEEVTSEHTCSATREYRIVRKDGSTAWVREALQTLSDDSGQVTEAQGIVEDITERKQAEEALRESEERYRAVVDLGAGVGEAVVMLQDDKHGDAVHVFFNREWPRITGYSREELLKMPFFDLVRPEDRKASQERHRRKMRGEAIPGLFEIQIIRKDGTQVPIEVTSAYTKYLGGTANVVYIRDITERKQAEAKHQAIIKTAVDGFWITDLAGRLLEVNDSYCEMVGYTHEELLEMSIPDIEAVETPKETARRIKKIVKQGYDRFETQHRRKDGRIIDVEISVNYLDVREGQLFVFIRDITERKLAENALKASEEKLRLMFKSVPEGITVSDMDGTILDTNETAVRMHGYDSKEEMLGKSSFELIAEKDHIRAMESLKETLERGQSATIEYTFLKKDGSEFPAELSAALLKDGAGNPVGFIAVTRDITARKSMEEQLVLTDRLASVGELASGIAHELNNPLTGVIGLAQLLVRRDVPEDIKEDLNLVYSEAQRAANIVKNLLTFARKHSPAEDLLNINDVINKVLELRAYEERVNNIEVVTHLAPDLPQVMADYFQLQQVFLNIVINAEYSMIEAHNKGTLTVTTERAGDYARASFTDDGLGIPKENLGHIFDPFFTTKEVGKGTGLGLSICHGIISAHNGQIYAESEPGKGATFIVELPLSQGEIE